MVKSFIARPNIMIIIIIVNYGLGNSITKFEIVKTLWSEVKKKKKE